MEEGKNKYDWSLYDGDTLLAYKKRDQDPVIIPTQQDLLIRKLLGEYARRLSQKEDFESKFYSQLTLLNDLRSENRKLHEHCHKFAKEVALKEAMFTDYEKVLWYLFDDIMSHLGEKSLAMVDELFAKAKKHRENPNEPW